MNKNSTIIVTGGAGYIGSHTIIELLATTPFNVVSIDNLSNSTARTYDRIEKITGKKVTAYNVDICDKAAVEAIFEKEKNVIGIIHFAAFKSVPESVSNPYKYYHNNIASLLNMLECCLKHKVDNFIFSSSCSVYGNISELPVKETSPLNKAESPYAYTKQTGEEIIKDYSKAFSSFNTVALRYFNPVGAHTSGLNGEAPTNNYPNFVPIITATAIGKIKQMSVYGTDYPTRDGTCIRDYIHVSDVGTAHIRALMYLIDKKNKTNFSVFNLGTGTGVSVLEAIHSFEKVSGQKLNYILGPKREGDVCSIYSDNSFSEKTLDWKPRYNLDEMMETAWKWELQLQKEQKA